MQTGSEGVVRRSAPAGVLDGETASARLAAAVDGVDTPFDEVRMLGWAVIRHNRVDEARQQIERWYAALLAAGRRRVALQAAITLAAWSWLAGETASARGWEQRALRLAQEFEPCIERGYLAMAQAGCEIPDPVELEQRAVLALELARRFGDRSLELRAEADLGLALVSQGRVDEGFALLDESATAAAAGEGEDPIQLGLSVCAMFSACQRTGDLSRGEYWCRRVESEPRLQASTILGTHCHLLHGDMDALCGDWDRAEQRFDQARSAPPGHTAVWHLVNSLAHLAELRLRQGRYQEAAELLHGHEDHFEVLPVLARLRAHEGRNDEAAALLRGYVRSLGADVIRLGPALEQLVDVQLRRGDPAAAEDASRRLLDLDESCQSNEIRALARLASARIAAHREAYVEAADELETGLTLLLHLDRPLLTARLRLELARALALTGDHGAARVEAEAALATFTKLRATPEVDAAHELLAGMERSPIAAAEGPAERAASVRHPLGAAEALTRREREIAGLVAEGLTNREIAGRLFLSVRTVETHVDRALGKLGFHTRTQLAAWVRDGAA